jgi:hypothetical protein
MSPKFYYHGHENPLPDPLYFESNKMFTSACRSTTDETLTVPAVTGVRDDVNRLQRERLPWLIFINEPAKGRT